MLMSKRLRREKFKESEKGREKGQKTGQLTIIFFLKKLFLYFTSFYPFLDEPERQVFVAFGIGSQVSEVKNVTAVLANASGRFKWLGSLINFSITNFRSNLSAMSVWIVTICMDGNLLLGTLLSTTAREHVLIVIKSVVIDLFELGNHLENAKFIINTKACVDEEDLEKLNNVNQGRERERENLERESVRFVKEE